jgi:hypothetical protein
MAITNYTPMGRRQHRVNGFSPKLSDLDGHIGQLVHVTLHDHRTLRAVLLAHTADALVLRNINAQWYNRRHHTQTVPLAAVSDVLLEARTR